MRISQLFILGALATAACSDSDTATAPDHALGRSPPTTRHYDVTITNLTSGQPLSPGVLVTHTKHRSIFRIGGQASEGIRLIAENGDPSTAAAEAGQGDGVADVVTTSAPVGAVGGSAFPSSLTVRVAAGGDANRLSLATMLICSNDGFTGLSGVRLPEGYQPETWYGAAYDAGTEVNTEADGDIVPPCFALTGVPGAGGGGRTAEHGLIAMHPGIAGGAALVPAVHGWSGAVVMVTVQRVKQ